MRSRCRRRGRRHLDRCAGVVAVGRCEADFDVVGGTPVDAAGCPARGGRSRPSPRGSRRSVCAPRHPPRTRGAAPHADKRRPKSWPVPTAPTMAMPVYRPRSGRVSHWGTVERMGPFAWCCSPKTTKRSPHVPGGGYGGSGRLTVCRPLRPRKMYISDVTTLHASHAVVNHRVAYA